MVRAMAAPPDDDPTTGSALRSGLGAAGAQLRLDPGDPAGQAGGDASTQGSGVRSCAGEMRGDVDEDVQPERFGPAGSLPEEPLPQRDEIWKCGQGTPVDCRELRMHSLHVSSCDLEERPRETNDAAELFDEGELREQLDMHSIIALCLDQEPLVTAEQVIEEIEEIMQDSPDSETERHPSQSDLSMHSVDIQGSSPGFEERLRSRSAAELLERLTETEANIRRFSEELVQQLAVRDELEFEKEVKNSFISALIDVQNRQKERRESLRKKRKLKGGAGPALGLPERTAGSRFSMDGLSSVIQNGFRQTFGSGCSEKQYLTTVIPYEMKGLPPSVEDLQILTKILYAMRDDSDKVPGLLTDYILNDELSPPLSLRWDTLT